VPRTITGHSAVSRQLWGWAARQRRTREHDRTTSGAGTGAIGALLVLPCHADPRTLLGGRLTSRCMRRARVGRAEHNGALLCDEKSGETPSGMCNSKAPFAAHGWPPTRDATSPILQWRRCTCHALMRGLLHDSTSTRLRASVLPPSLVFAGARPFSQHCTAHHVVTLVCDSSVRETLVRDNGTTLVLHNVSNDATTTGTDAAFGAETYFKGNRH